GEDGAPSVYRKPVAANRSETFIAGAYEVRSRTFLAHIRHATSGEPRVDNTHPFEQHGRLFAHNGVLGDLPGLRRRLGRHIELVHSGERSILPATAIASERMDTTPGWRLLESGELVHVDSGLQATTTIAVPDPPAQMMELSAQEAVAQAEDPARSAG